MADIAERDRPQSIQKEDTDSRIKNDSLVQPHILGKDDPNQITAGQKRSDSINQQARPHSQVFDSSERIRIPSIAGNSSARRPSIIGQRSSTKQSEHNFTTKDDLESASKVSVTRHRRNRSLDNCLDVLDKKASTLEASKSRSENNLLDAKDSVSSYTVSNQEYTHQHNSNESPDAPESNHLISATDPLPTSAHTMIDYYPYQHYPQGLMPFPNGLISKDPTPNISPLSSVSLCGRTVPIQASDREALQHSCYIRLPSNASVSSYDTEHVSQEINDLKKRVAKLEESQLTSTPSDICIPNVERALKVARDLHGKKHSASSAINHAPFYTKSNQRGHKLCVKTYLNGDGKGKGTHFSVFFAVMQGKNDTKIAWPFNHEVTFRLIHQSGGDDIIETILPKTIKNFAKDPAFQRPKSEMNTPTGFPCFVSHETLFGSEGGYVLNDTIKLQVSVNADSAESRQQTPEHCSEK